MKTADFFYDLPESLIAQNPLPQRTASRLLLLDGETGACQDKKFTDLLHWLKPDDLLVFNNTRVIPARLFGQKETGGKLELLVERVVSEQRVLAHIRCSKSPKPGSRILLESGLTLDVIGREGELFDVVFPDDAPAMEYLNAHGHMPLPPYIHREDQSVDRECYQTVYSEVLGAVAAPTAGLHFDESLLQKIKAKGVQTACLTLHVGAGTFQPVRVDNILEHTMHAERIDVPETVVAAVQKAKAAGGRVIAVGTTVMRSLETASQSGELQSYQGESRLFIYPGYKFHDIDAMITNFHLPESTLLMLVSAFAGTEHIKKAYQHAIEQQYRFFSYGDAMLITPQTLKLG